MKIVGNKIYAVCGTCGQIVQTNKFLVGGLHICTVGTDTVKDSQMRRNLYTNNLNYLKNLK